MGIKERIEKLGKKKLVVLIVLLILIIGVVGYFAYTSYATTQFNKGITESFGHYKTGEEIFKSMKGNNNSNFAYNSELSVIGTEKHIEDNDKIINSITKEITILNKTKNFANSNEEKEYINLLIKQREDSKKYYEVTKKWYDINLAYGKGDIASSQRDAERAKLLKGELKNTLSDKEDSFYKLKEFIISHPGFKQRLISQEVGVNFTYIGEKDPFKKDSIYIDPMWW